MTTSVNPIIPTPASSTSMLQGITRYSELKSTSVNNASTMGKTEFLTLFTTQLKSQDPLDPVKNEAFVAQLAQFSQLEASTNMSNSLENMSKAIKSERFISGSALIGKQVTAPMGNADYKEGNDINGLISLPNGADSITLDVYDSGNNKIYSQKYGRQMPGYINLSWDGSLTSGGKALSGTYKMIATVNSLGKSTQTTISTPATVKSVTYSAEADDLIIEVEGGATVPLSQVNRIDRPSMSQ